MTGGSPIAPGAAVRPANRAPATLLALGLAVAGLGGCSGEDPKARERPGGFDKPTPVVTEQPERVSLEDVFLEREATLVAVATAQISTRQEGFVSQVAPEVGDMVHEGDFLAQIDETDTKLQLVEAEAEMRHYSASVDDGQRSFKRAQELFKREVLSQGELDDRQTALARARAEFEEARARRDRIQVTLYGLKIVAPMPGVVTSVYTEGGEYLQRGAKVLELKRIDSVVALCTVSERYIGQVSEGSSVRVEVTAFPERSLQGLVWKIVGDALLESRSFPVKVLLSNQDLTLKPGMSARVSFVRRVDDGLLVPKDAILEEDDQPFVFLVTDGHAERRPVELGTAVGDRWHVRAGVTAQDQVVVAGNEDLHAGDAVLLVDLPQPGPPTLPAPDRPDIASGS